MGTRPPRGLCARQAHAGARRRVWRRASPQPPCCARICHQRRVARNRCEASAHFAVRPGTATASASRPRLADCPDRVRAAAGASRSRRGEHAPRRQPLLVGGSHLVATGRASAAGCSSSRLRRDEHALCHLSYAIAHGWQGDSSWPGWGPEWFWMRLGHRCHGASGDAGGTEPVMLQRVPGPLSESLRNPVLPNPRVLPKRDARKFVMHKNS